MTISKITIERGGSYAPCCYLICRVHADGTWSKYHESNTVLVQTDWDFPSVASTFGYVPCECGATDGTIDCPHHTATEMISAAADWLDEHEGMIVDDPGYFEE